MKAIEQNIEKEIAQAVMEEQPMQPLSTRTAHFTDSVIRRMTRISNQYGAVNLSQGFPDFDPPKAILDRLAEVAHEDYHQYSITWGAQNFREALAAKQTRYMGRTIDPNSEIVVTCGSTEAMMAAMMTVTNPGDKVIIFSPFYENYGADTILQKIGADATGLPFNSIMAILLENDHPSTPLVNAGAISADSMVKPVGNSEAKWKAITDNMRELSGSDLKLLDELYKSESETNFNNRSIAWLLKNFNRIYDDPDMSLDLYTRQCSMGVTAKQLSIAACTIANNGLNPVTKQQVFDPSLSPKITSLIATVGFYEHTGDWLYTSGVPAKSGVGGGVLGVVPGLFGIAAFAPPLDEAGNSVKAQAAIKYIAQKLNVNVFGGDHVEVIN